MLSTSAEFQTKINAHARKSPNVLIRINYTDAFLDPTIDATSADENYVTQTDQLVNGRVDATYKYICCDDQSILDGSYAVLPDTADSASFNEMGWWSATRTDGTGLVNVTAQITYSKRKVSSLFIAGDIQRGEYPIDFTAKFYDGVSLIYTETVTGNALVQLTKTFTQIDDIDKVVLNVTKWSEPNTPVKIVEFTTQVTVEYTGSSVVGFTALEESEISNDNSIPTGNISASTANFSLINIDRIFDANNTNSKLYGLIKPNALVEMFIGVDATAGIEYIPIFKGWVTDWDVPEQDKTVSSSAQDRLNLLTQTKITTSTVIEDDTFYDWFETVLNDAGLANTEYDIDTTFQGSDYIIPYFWFDAVGHRNALEQLAQGCSAVVYVDRGGLIVIKALDNFPGGSVQTFTQDDYTDKDNQPVYQNVANNISVTTSPLVKSTGVTVYETGTAEPEEIGASTTTSYTIFYSDKPIADHVVSIDPPVANVSISSESNFAWGSTISVQNTGGATTFQFKVVGSTFEVSGQKTVTRTDSQSIIDNGELSFNYPRVAALQKKVLAEAIADTLLASFKDAQRDLNISFDVGGNPSIELRDTITVTDSYTSKAYKIISTEINYDGGLGIVHKGRV
jgi:hypothetical protein